MLPINTESRPGAADWGEPALSRVFCAVPPRQEKSLPAKQRVTRRLSRAVSTTVTGLKTMRSIRPNYVQQSDYIVTLWDDKQRAEKAAASANKRARAAEQTLKNNGLTPQGWRGFASGVSSVGDSLFRSLSRALSIGTRKSSVDRTLSVEAPGSIPEAPHRGPSYAQGSGGRVRQPPHPHPPFLTTTIISIGSRSPALGSLYIFVFDPLANSENTTRCIWRYVRTQKGCITGYPARRFGAKQSLLSPPANPMKYCGYPHVLHAVELTGCRHLQAPVGEMTLPGGAT